MRAGTRARLTRLAHVLGWGVSINVVLGAASGSALPDAPLLAALQGALGGAVNAAIVLGTICVAEIFLPRTRLGEAIERAPFLGSLAVKLLAYGAVIALVVGGRPGARLAALAAGAVYGAPLARAIYAAIQPPTAPLVATWLLGVGVAVFMIQIGRLIGYRTLGDILFGRYHRSRAEERFFLFVDIVGSTPLAERLGPDAIHRFLREVFRVASDPIDGHGGEVHQYVGDEMVITWTLADGRPGAQPLACLFAIDRALAQATAGFERRFGAAPRLRAALHAGEVLTGEVGGSRRAIVFHGDAMNTASRLEQATRELDRPFLVSGDALERLADLDAFAFEDLGTQRLRGRAAATRVYAVSPRSSAAASAPPQPPPSRSLD